MKAGLGWGGRTVVRGAGAVVGDRVRRGEGKEGERVECGAEGMLGWRVGGNRERERSARRGRTTDKAAGKWVLVPGEESVGYIPSFERPAP